MVDSLAVLLLSAPWVAAFNQSGQPPRFGQPVRSPEVLPDRRVIFRFKSPNAKSVSVVFDGLPKIPMAKDESGVWSVTTGPLDPDLYSYSIVVDGIAIADPANDFFKPVVSGGAESIVHVPGRATQIWEAADVPHGALHRHTYHSKKIGESRNVWVYTPPGYEASPKQSYPVLYLLHGVMEDATAWSSAGQAQVILDNLIAAKKAVPMILVMPLGYGFRDAPDQVGRQFGGLADQRKFLDAFSHSLLDEIIPLIERTYRVKRDRQSRAIAGVSMGGLQSLAVGLNHLDVFAWIGSFSGALIMLEPQYEKWLPNLSSKSNDKIDLLWVSCGKEDFLFGVNGKFKAWLSSLGVKSNPIETPGGHTWQVWRRNLIEFAPLLFR